MASVFPQGAMKRQTATPGFFQSLCPGIWICSPYKPLWNNIYISCPLRTWKTETQLGYGICWKAPPLLA